VLDDVANSMSLALAQDARTHLAFAAQAQGHGGRGLHSSTSEPNLFLSLKPSH
jgi:hypothetical protein